MVDWGSAYFEHLSRWFKQPTARSVFSGERVAGSMQVLVYDKVFRGCLTFVSLGLSRYPKEIGLRAELFVPADAGWEFIPEVLSNVLFYVVESRLQLGPGIAVSGISAVKPEFAKRFGKEALYFTEPFGVPEDVARVRPAVRGSDEEGTLLMGTFISEAEFDYLEEHGEEALERAFHEKGVDPFAVARPSVF